MKFFVKDEDGQKFEVEEVEEMEETTETTDEELLSLTNEEITALKNLAARAEEIIKLLEVENREHQATEGDEEMEEKEIVVDTDEEAEEALKKAHDSKSAIGSIQRKPVVNDSIDDIDEINSAWTKYYGGK